MTIIDLSAPEPKDSTPTSGSNLAITSGGVKTALDGKVDLSSLATVATSGSYNDLSDKPTIPTNTDINVTQQLISTNNNYPLLMAGTTIATSANVTTTARRNNSIYANPSTGAIYAQKFYADGQEIGGGGKTITPITEWGQLFTLLDNSEIGDEIVLTTFKYVTSKGSVFGFEYAHLKYTGDTVKVDYNDHNNVWIGDGIAMFSVRATSYHIKAIYDTNTIEYESGNGFSTNTMPTTTSDTVTISGCYHIHYN